VARGVRGRPRRRDARGGRRRPAAGFTAVRDALLAFYPDDLRLERLARRLHAAGQSGQYNWNRCRRRGEVVAASLALAEFVDAALAVVFLLARRYRPFPKWAHRALGDLPQPGPRLHALLAELVAAPSSSPALVLGLVEEIAALLADSLRAEGLSSTPSDFLVDHAREVGGLVSDPLLRRRTAAP
jgi:hypothetical protein